MSSDSKLAVVPDAPAPARRAPVPPASLAHRELLVGEFWRRVPAYANVGEAEFLDHVPDAIGRAPGGRGRAGLMPALRGDPDLPLLVALFGRYAEEGDHPT